MGDNLFGAGREDCGVDLAGRDRIDADAERAEVGRHLAGQRRERRLRRGIGGAGEWMHARARNRGDVDHRALRGLELVDEPAREHDRGEEIHPEDVVPHIDGGVERGEPLAALGLGRDCGVVDQRMQLAIVQALLDLVDCRKRAIRIGEIDLDVVLRAHLPRAVLRKCMTRAGDDAPAGGREALDGEMADAAARPGQEQRTARLVVV